MKFAALGRTQWLYDSIRALVSAGHQIVLIGTCPAAPEYTVTEQDFIDLAKELGCPSFCTSAVNYSEYLKMIMDSGADIAVSVNWLTLIGRTILEQFKYGVINAHAGDLPRYRGNAVANWAILSGESKIVLTFHQMAIELDAGPILCQVDFPLTPETYIGEIFDFFKTGIPLGFVQVLKGFELGTIIPKPQPTDPAISLRCFPRIPRDSEINWQQPAELLARLVRASAEPFLGAYTFLEDEKLTIWRAYPSRLSYQYLGSPGQVAERNQKTGEVVVITGDGVLVLQEVESVLRGRKPAGEIIRSIRVRLGFDYYERFVQLERRIHEAEEKISGKISGRPTVAQDPQT